MRQEAGRRERAINRGGRCGGLSRLKLSRQDWPLRGIGSDELHDKLHRSQARAAIGLSFGATNLYRLRPRTPAPPTIWLTSLLKPHPDCFQTTSLDLRYQASISHPVDRSLVRSRSPSGIPAVGSWC